MGKPKNGPKNGLGKTAVFVSDTSRPQKKRLIAVVVAFLVIAAIAILIVLLGSRSSPKTTSVEQTQQHSEVLKSVANDDKTDNYSQEAKKLQAYIDSNPSSEYAATEVVRLAATYQNSQDYDNAIKWYQVAVNKYPQSKLAGIRGLAFVYEAKGDNQKAIEYFNQAIEIEKSDPSTVYMVGKEQSNIRHLQGQTQ